MNHSGQIVNQINWFKITTWHHSIMRLAIPSTVIDLRPVAPAITKSCKNNTKVPSHQTTRLFCRKHVFYKVWQYCSVCTCRHNSAINHSLKRTNQKHRKLRQTHRDWSPHPSVTYNTLQSHPRWASWKVSSLRSLPSHSSPLNSRELS